MPFNFGSFAGGLAGGLREGQRMQLEAEAHKLKSKMLEQQMKALEFDQAEKQRKAAEDTAQAAEVGKFVQMMGKGVQQQAAPGYESEAQQMSVAPVQQYRPASPEELRAQAVAATPRNQMHQLTQEMFKAGKGPAEMSEYQRQSLDLQRRRLDQPREGVGVESQTWSRIVKENPGADLNTLTSKYNDVVKGRTIARGEGGEVGKLNVRSTPEYLSNVTAQAEAKTAGGPLPAGVEDVLAKGDVLSQTVKDIRANYDRNYLGPVKGTNLAFEARRRVGSSMGMPTEDKEVKFRQALADAKNQIVYLMSGKQINEAEGKRLMAQMPAATDEPGVFLAGLNRFEDQVKRALVAHKQAGTATRSTVSGSMGPAKLVPRQP